MSYEFPTPDFPVVSGTMYVPGLGLCEVEPTYIGSIFQGYRIIPLDFAGHRCVPAYMEIKQEHDA